MKAKKFQFESARHICHQIRTNGSGRFLLADEPGLGKTVVAREVISQLLADRPGDAGKMKVVYICSNMGIIMQNVQRLIPDSEHHNIKDAFNSRLTLWPITKKWNQRGKLEIFSFTPGTSLYLGRSLGTYRERALLMSVIRGICRAEGVELYSTDAFDQIFRGTVQDWDACIDRIKRNEPKILLSDKNGERLLRKYAEFVRTKEAIRILGFKCKADQVIQSLIAKIQDLKQCINNHVEGWQEEVRFFIKRGRLLLAAFALEDLSPDLIILDEFQCYREVLEDAEPSIADLDNNIEEDDNAEYIVRRLFGNDGNDAKMLLLSATPYRMYTTYEEKPHKGHYWQFAETMKFLMAGSHESYTALDELLKGYRRELFSESLNELRLMENKVQIEKILKRYMIRTERKDLISGVAMPICESRPDDNGSFILDDDSKRSQRVALLSDKSLREIDDLLRASNRAKYPEGVAVSYWKCGSYLSNFMSKNDYGITKVFRYLKKPDRDLRHCINRQKDFEARNHQLEYLRKLVFDIWKNGDRLWMRPTLPYVSAPDSSIETNKILIFSHWRFVPRYISALMSNYSAKILMDQCLESEAEDKERTKLLKFDGKSISPFLLFYPSYTLARLLQPSEYVKPPDCTLASHLKAVKQLAKARLIERMEQLGYQIVHNERRPEMKHVAYKLFHMDDVSLKTSFKERFEIWMDKSKYNAHDDDVDIDELEYLKKYYDIFTALDDEYQDKKMAIAYSELDLLTELAIKSPAVAIVRSLLIELCQCKQESPAHIDVIDDKLDSELVRLCFNSLRSFFNRIDSRRIIRRSKEDTDTRGYWTDVLDYCFSEDWQAVMDEYVYLLVCQHSLHNIVWPIDTKEERTNIDCFFQEFAESLSLKRGSIQISGGDTPIRLARLFALSYEDDNSGDRQIRRDQIRSAFNSPFWPFVLATTTVGQEGIDFHRYCSDVMHWNLPSNPVDLEQREGRVDRFLGIAVRRNIIRKNYRSIVNRAINNISYWQQAIEIAESDPESDGELSPCWLYKNFTQGYSKIRRHVVHLPFSRDRYYYEALKRTLAFYRIAFGQPRQTELVNHWMNNKKIDERSVGKFFLSLSPGKNKT